VRSDIRPRGATGNRGRAAGRPAAEAPWPGPLVTAVLAAARRRAVRDAERQVDTAHLLHALLECDPAAREELERATGDGRQLRTARVLAYLAQRSIGYGLRWRNVVEGPADRAPAPGAVGLSPSAVLALSGADAVAAAAGRTRPAGPDLLAALAADPACRAAEVLRAAGADPARLAPRAARATGS
jgi:hypothetical protein